jgi:cytochrome c biogenesis protein
VPWSLLVLNLAACTINRFPAIWRTVRHPAVKPGQGFFERGRHRAWFTSSGLSQQEASDIAAETLRRQHYQVTIGSGPDSTHVYAERNRYARFGTFLTHGGIILAIAAALWGNLTGFSENALAIPDGSVREVGYGTELSVLNEGFTEEDYPDGRPKDFRSDLVIYERGIEVKRQTIRVNQPLEYKGVRFHQAFFGNAVVMRVRDTADDELLFEDGVALAYRNKTYGEARPVGFFTLFDGMLTVDVVSTAQDAADSSIRPGEVVIVVYRSGDRALWSSEKLVQREPLEIAGLEFTFLREKQFTGLSVVKNPGVNFLWLATAFIVLGMCTVLYFPHRRVWALCVQSIPEPTLALAGAAPRLVGFDREFQRLASALELELSRAGSSSDSGLNSPQGGKERRL